MSTAAVAPLPIQTVRREPFVMARLSLMMFCQYAVWGVWLPILANYLGTPPARGGLGFDDGQKGWILGVAASLGAVLSPFVAGQLADRVMNAERALGLLLVLGGLLQIYMTWQTGFGVWLALLTLYSVLYMPTLALTNSVAFANLADRERQFPVVRTFGTIGWIVGSVGFSLAFLQTAVRPVGSWPFLAGQPVADEGARMRYAMLVAGVISLAYGAMCFLLLPKTPPRRGGARPLAFTAAFELLTSRGCLPLLAAALVVAMIHQVYFIRMGDYVESIWGSKGPIAPTMAIGQVSEIVFLAILGLFIKRVGYKWIITLGALSYAARYGIFAIAPTRGAVQLAMLLHGMSYGFFFAGAYLFVERLSPGDIRHSVQTAFGIIILGLGPILASPYNTLLQRWSLGADGHVRFGTLWGIQAGLAVVAMVTLLALFSGRIASDDRAAS